MPNTSNGPPNEPPKFPSVFRMELTPPDPVINPDVPFSMTVKNMSKEIQAVEVEVDSFLFEIMNARAKVWPYSQIYHKVEPGGTLSFEIGVMKEIPKNALEGNNIMNRWKTPEGLLKIYHETATNMDDSEAGWGYDENEFDQYYIMPGRRTRILRESPTEEHGHVEMGLVCEKETELIKKRKEEFNEKKMKKELEKKREKKSESKIPNISLGKYKPKFPNVFKLELTPPKPVINPDVPFSMTVKNMSKEIQAVEIEVDSFIFELLNPRVESGWPYSQIYHKVGPGGTLSFQIGFVKKMPKEDCRESYNVTRLKTPEGLLKIYHTADSSMDDTGEGWGYDLDPSDPYYVLPAHRSRFLQESLSLEHGHVEMELVCEKETEVIKKRKKKFYKKKIKEEKREKKQREGGSSCTIL